MTIGPPPLLLLTDRRQSEHAGRTLTETVHRAVDAGANAFVLREKDLPPHERAALASELRRTVPLLLVASDSDLAIDVGADGVHLAARDRMPAPEHPELMIGRSCHDATTVRSAIAEGASYVTLSPVFESASKPGYGPALGLDTLAGHPGHVWALGGITPRRAAACIRAGATGIAVMGAVMAATNPGRVVAQLINALDAR
jgi:thiamine-phosphate diphosphorylase